ncbi:hypothetical protein, partial [Proteus terrae]|uniref:hypothetical protein n=1 Tax=Proteus terrae TaxID=1574161 RepID=UPI00288A7DBA
MAKKPQKIGTSFNLPTNEHFFLKNYCQPQKTPYNASSLSRHRALSELTERTKKKVKSLENKRLTP